MEWARHLFLCGGHLDKGTSSVLGLGITKIAPKRMWKPSELVCSECVLVECVLECLGATIRSGGGTGVFVYIAMI